MTAFALATLLALMAGGADGGAPPEFVSGVHLRNDDDASRELLFVEPLNAGLCAVRHPTPGMKNGLVGAASRSVPGLEVTRELPGDGGSTLSLLLRFRARVAPRTSVSCLCARPCDVQLPGGAALSPRSGDTVVIRGGQLVLERRRAR